MTHFSLIGCRSGKSIPRMLPLTRDASLLMTEEAQRFLSVIAPRAYREATLLAVALKVTVLALFYQAISEGLIVRTTFSILTPCKLWNGQILRPSSQDSRLFSFTNMETSQHHPLISSHLLDTLTNNSSKCVHGLNSSTFHVLTSQKIIHAEASPLLAQSFGQSPASPYREFKRA